MIDLTHTKWIYINHYSFFIWLFYTSLALGLTSLSISIIKDNLSNDINLVLFFYSIFSYLLINKTVALFFQIFISIFFLIDWQKFFKDWVLILFPILGIIFTTFLGTNLSISDNQIWHIFIGPSGTISVLTFYLVLKRSQKKFT